jgi:drug/metabolite transporter (DMT)-like permease
MSARDRRIALAALAGACAAWGLSFVLIKDLDRTLSAELAWSPWTASTWIVAVRFLLAFAVLATLPAVRRGLRSRSLHRDAFLLALPSAAGYALQAAGMRGMDPGVNAFLTSLYTPLTPLLGWLLFRRVPPGKVLAAVPVALAGVVLLTGPAGAGFGLDEALVVVGAVFWALQILFIDRYARRHAAGPYSAAYFLWSGILGLVALGVTREDRTAADLLGPLLRADLLPAVAALVLLSTVLALFLLVRFQPRVDPSRAALLYVLEPVFAAIFAATLRGEPFGGWKLAGCLLLLGANVLVEVRPPGRRTSQPC